MCVCFFIIKKESIQDDVQEVLANESGENSSTNDVADPMPMPMPMPMMQFDERVFAGLGELFASIARIEGLTNQTGHNRTCVKHADGPMMVDNDEFRLERLKSQEVRQHVYHIKRPIVS